MVCEASVPTGRSKKVTTTDSQVVQTKPKNHLLDNNSAPQLKRKHRRRFQRHTSNKGKAPEKSSTKKSPRHSLKRDHVLQTNQHGEGDCSRKEVHGQERNKESPRKSLTQSSEGKSNGKRATEIDKNSPLNSFRNLSNPNNLIPRGHQPASASAVQKSQPFHLREKKGKKELEGQGSRVKGQ